MKNILYLFGILTLTASCSNKFPQYKHGAKNKVIVNADEDSQIISITSENDREINLSDATNVNNLLFLREGKGITCTNGYVPICLKGKKKYKLKFYVDDSQIFERNKEKIPDLIQMANNFLDELLLGIEISLYGSNWHHDIESVENMLKNPCAFRDILSSKNTVAVIISQQKPSNIKAFAKDCENGLLIISGGAIFNPVTFTHEIMHLFTIDNENDDDIMKKTIPVEDTIYSLNLHAFKSKKIDHYNGQFAKQQQSEIYFVNPAFSSVSSSGGNSLNSLDWARFLSPENENSNWNERILYTMHPEEVTEQTPGFDLSISPFLTAFTNDSIPADLRDKMEDVYDAQYDILVPKHNEEKIPWYKQYFGFLFSSKKFDLSKTVYKNLSLENLKYIRDTNMLYWIARKKKIGIDDVSTAEEAIAVRGLNKNYEAIQGVID
ncbi:MAG: hypothetical protein AAGA77_03880 [Bacteroidota bacterium]